MTRVLSHRTRPSVAVLAALTAAGIGVSQSQARTSPAAGGHASTSGVDPSKFAARISNPWLPFRAGTTWVYRGVKDGKATRTVFTVTHRTRVVDGVRCTVIADRVYSAGRLEERTTDYYVQDKQGGVWYFGEDTAKLDSRGRVISTDGTWHSGVSGARPGLFMPADPRVGEHHRQEYYKGHAEDQYRVTSRTARVTVPYGSFRNALRVREWTALEPGVVDTKYYVRGIGRVFEGSISGPKERAELVSFRRP